MTNLCCDVLNILKGKTLATAESCTGGGIGHALTAISGSSAVFKGGIISYCNEVKAELLGVDRGVLESLGAVSALVAEQMAQGARRALCTDVSVSVTGLAGSDPDEFGHAPGTVFIGYSDASVTCSREFHFSGNREDIRDQAIRSALLLILEQQK